MKLRSGARVLLKPELEAFVASFSRDRRLVKQEKDQLRGIIRRSRWCVFPLVFVAPLISARFLSPRARRLFTKQARTTYSYMPLLQDRFVLYRTYLTIPWSPKPTYADVLNRVVK